MLMEEALDEFYEMMYNDTQEFLSNHTKYDKYIAIFR